MRKEAIVLLRFHASLVGFVGNEDGWQQALDGGEERTRRSASDSHRLCFLLIPSLLLLRLLSFSFFPYGFDGGKGVL